ncbi:multidrug resistance protein MdtH [Klebsiella pneumoniae]|uniref:Multidrug resistance protein MdtH n=1 Tax=Klebsiella pneumoniae TaxID=573 RepID=A0A2X1S895_KLEPN|nr:multidrug resistance protein MdtH [Klebsiella pneumoniae]
MVLVHTLRTRRYTVRSAAAALVVKLVRPHQRGRFFSILMMQDSAGAVIGALLGSWLLQYDFRLVCSAGAALFIACARV